MDSQCGQFRKSKDFFSQVDKNRFKDFKDPKFFNAANATLMNILGNLDSIFKHSKCAPGDCISSIVSRSDSRFYQSKTLHDIDLSTLPPCVKDQVKVRMQKYFDNIKRNMTSVKRQNLNKTKYSNKNDKNFKFKQEQEQEQNQESNLKENYDYTTYDMKMDPIGQ